MLNNKSKHSTIIEAFEFIENQKPESICFTFGSEEITYAQLGAAIRKLAIALSVHDLKSKTVLIVNKTSFEFIVQFMACVYVGAIPIPSYHPDETSLFLKRFLVIMEKGSFNHILTNEENKLIISSILADNLTSTLVWLTTETMKNIEGEKPEPDCSEIAFIQFSSGSTGDPKGVAVTHTNLLFCVEKLASVLMLYDIIDDDFWGLNWLPLYHDMGLVGAFLLPLLVGFPMAMMLTKTFMQNPYAWLEELSRTKAKITLAPNFAYDRCVDAMVDVQDVRIDLSNLRVAFNGGEHVSYDTIARFTNCFQSLGFIPEAMCPAYGLAEATLIVTSNGPEGPKVLRVDQELYSKMIIREVSDASKAINLVSSGHLLLGINVVIVNPGDRTPCEDMQVGEIMVSANSVTSGYYGIKDSSDNFRVQIPGYEETFLQTGDLGFIKEGHLFITGRLKDLIIINGRNIDPQTVEEIVTSVDEQLSHVFNAVFSVCDHDVDKMVLVQELPNSIRGDDLKGRIHSRIEESLDLHFFDMVFVHVGAIIKTSIGKVSRKECKNMYLSGNWA